MILSGGINALVGLTYPYLAKLGIDEGIGKKDFKALIILLLAGGAVFLLSALLEGPKDYWHRYVKLKVSFDLKKKVLRKMQDFSFTWFQSRSTAEHLYKMEHDLEAVTDLVTDVFPLTLALFSRLLPLLFIIFYLNWRIALFSLCLIPFLCAPFVYFIRKMKRLWEESLENSQDTLKVLEENMTHIQLIKVFGREAASTRSYLKKLIRSARIVLRRTKLEIASLWLNQGMMKIATGLVSLYGASLVIAGRLTLGSLTAIMGYLYQLLSMQDQVSALLQTSMQSSISVKRVNEILEEDNRVEESRAAKTVIFNRGDIVFKNVSFEYSKDSPILRGMSFSLPGSTHIALIGPSGCGKSTLLHLLVRLFEPQEGEILIDGSDIRNMKLNSLKSQIGFSLQEPFLWNDTIENNIRFGKEGGTDAEIRFAAGICGVDEVAKRSTFGYATVIGENASKISEGEKQRIAIARALVKLPKILILDEAMSSLDSESELKIMANIKRAFKGLTVISVSHRLSTVMQAELACYFLNPHEMTVDRPEVLFSTLPQLKELFNRQERILV